ncbi:MAG: type IV pilus assembly protein PilM [Acidaminococcaceae bacterium]
MNFKHLLNKLFFPSPKLILGIDLGAERVKVVQMNLKGRKPLVEDFVIADLPLELKTAGLTQHTEEMASFLHEVIYKHGFTAKYAIFSIGGRNAFVREIDMPNMPEAEMRQAVTWDAGQYVPYEADSYYVDFAEFGTLTEDGQQPIMLVAAPRDVVDSLVAVGDFLNLEIIKLDIEVLSTYRTLGETYQNFLLLDMGNTFSKITIFQTGAPVAQRSIPHSTFMFSGIIAQALEIERTEADQLIRTKDFLLKNNSAEEKVHKALVEAADDLVRECQRTSEYYIMNKKTAVFTHLVLVGSGSNLSGLTSYLQEKLSLKVEQHDILKQVAFSGKYQSDKVKAVAQSLTVAIGAAMSGGDLDD